MLTTIPRGQHLAQVAPHLCPPLSTQEMSPPGKGGRGAGRGEAAFLSREILQLGRGWRARAGRGEEKCWCGRSHWLGAPLQLIKEPFQGSLSPAELLPVRHSAPIDGLSENPTSSRWKDPRRLDRSRGGQEEGRRARKGFQSHILWDIQSHAVRLGEDL